MAYDAAGRPVGDTPRLVDYFRQVLQQEGYYDMGQGQWTSPGAYSAIDMITGAPTMPLFTSPEELAANPMAAASLFPGMAANIERFLNTYYLDSDAVQQVAGKDNPTVPISYVPRDPVKGEWKEGPIDMQSGGSMLFDPTSEHVYDPVAFYKSERGEAMGLTDWDQSDWEAYMGDANTPGAGRWAVTPQGQLQWIASSPVKNDPNAHNWFQNAVGPTLANLITSILPTALGGYIGGPAGAAAGNFVGQLLTPGVTERGGPNFVQMGLAALSPYAGEGLAEGLSGAAEWAGGALSSVPAEALTEGGMATAEGVVAGSAEELFAEAGSGILNEAVEAAPGVMGEITPTVDLGRDITGIEMGMTPESPLGPGISDITMEATGSMAGGDVTSSIVDFLTNPETWKTAAQIGEAGLNIIGGIQGANPDFGPLPELLAAGSPPAAMPALDKTMPAGPSWEFPAGAQYPDITSGYTPSYFPRNWDAMSEAERQAWLIQRGGAATKRRRGTYAGNLLGMRGGTDLSFAELAGTYPGAQLLGG